MSDKNESIVSFLVRCATEDWQTSKERLKEVLKMVDLKEAFKAINPFENQPAGSGIQRMLDSLNTGELAEIFDKGSQTFKDIKEASKASMDDLPKGLNRDYELMEVAKVGDHYIALFAGGNNGTPDWHAYFTAIDQIMLGFGLCCMHPYLIQLYNDCPDDVHYVYIGFKCLPYRLPEPGIETDPELRDGYELDDESDRWGTRKFRIYFNGTMCENTWRQINKYIQGYGNGFYHVGDLVTPDKESTTGYFLVTATCVGVKPCPAGEYKLWLEDVDKMVEDLESLFPQHIERRGPVFVNRHGEDK